MATRERGRPVGRGLTHSAIKERKRQSDRKRSREKIFIGDHFERWTRVKEELNFTFNYELAGYLLDRYEHGVPLQKKTQQVSSTPLHGKPFQMQMMEPVSDILSAESGKHAELSMSGVEELDAGPSSRKRAKGTKHSTSFLDPFELSIEISTEDSEYSEASDDETYYPSFNISIGPKNVAGIKDCPGVESVFPQEEEEEEEGEEEEEEIGPSVLKLNSPDDIHHVLEKKTALVYVDQLLALAHKPVHTTCKVKGCGKALQCTSRNIGSALYLKWVCPNSHTADKWCSQPVLNRGLHAGDLMIASAILFSGNNFSKIELFSQFLNLGFLSASSFTRLQRNYLVPSVDDLWSEKKRNMVQEFRNNNLVLLGDGRMDSPGHCAQYCTYTFMENSTKKILSITTLDKRETEKKSTNLEKAGFLKGMREVKDNGLIINEVVTDAHLQIGAMMKKNHAEIKHSHDIWHAAKNLGKKLISAGQEKNCKDLLKWSKDIVNHFWYTSQTANTVDEFMGMWVGVLHHVVGEHEWLLPYSEGGVPACSHGPLTGEDRGEKEYLVKGSQAHEALRKVVLDKRFLNKIHYYLNFRSTAELESFHNHLLMYSSKRYAYTPPVYRARSILAALDYNGNIDRAPIKNRDGSLRLQRTYNKKSGRWSVYPVKEKKYDHVIALMEKVLHRRLDDRVGVHQPMGLEAGDPRRISRTVAPKLPPPTAQIELDKKSRFDN